MRIIERGTRPTPWWARTEWVCRKCNSRFELDHTDEDDVIIEDTYQGLYAQYDCPVCEETIWKENR